MRKAKQSTTTRPRLSRYWRAERRTIARLEDDGYTVARLSASQRPPSDRKPIDAVNLIAFRNREVIFVAVRTDRRLGERKARRLREMKATFSNHSKVIEWIWAERATEPEERRIA